MPPLTPLRAAARPPSALRPNHPPNLRRGLRTAVALACAQATLAPAEELSLREQKPLGPEACLALSLQERPLRCPELAGRQLELAGHPAVVVDQLGNPTASTLWCDRPGSTWRCRKVVVVDRSLRGAQKRDPQAFVTAAELLRQLATAPTVVVGEDFGTLLAPGAPPRTCREVNGRGCAIQAVRLRVRDGASAQLRRQLWLVEDAEGPLLQCADAGLTRCAPLSAAAWTVLALTLRPSRQQPAQPAPELDPPQVRADRRPPEPAGTEASTADPSTGRPTAGPDRWAGPERPESTLPFVPAPKEVTRVARALEQRGGRCLRDRPRARVSLRFSGAGRLLALSVEGARTGSAEHRCLEKLASQLRFPRFQGPSYQLQAIVARR